MSESQKSPKELYKEFKAQYQLKGVSEFGSRDAPGILYQWSCQRYWIELGKLGPDAYQLFLNDPEQTKQIQQLKSELETTDFAERLSDNGAPVSGTITHSEKRTAHLKRSHLKLNGVIAGVISLINH